MRRSRSPGLPQPPAQSQPRAPLRCVCKAAAAAQSQEEAAGLLFLCALVQGFVPSFGKLLISRSTPNYPRDPSNLVDACCLQMRQNLVCSVAGAADGSAAVEAGGAFAAAEALARRLERQGDYVEAARAAAQADRYRGYGNLH